MKTLLHNHIARLLLLLAAALPLGACSDKEPETPARRTVLVYMEARNSLYANASDDLAEMERAAIPADCRLLVYYSSYSSQPQLLEIKNGRRTVLQTWPDGTSAVNPAQLSAVLAETRRLAPSRELGLVLWSHSSGWQQASARKTRAFGLENNTSQMSISALAGALKGQDLDFIFFDTCYMGCVEVAYELRDCARYMVGSVCEVPMPGMPYNLTVTHLMDDDMAAGLAKAADATVDSYLPSATRGCPSTLSVIDLSLMDSLAAEVKAKSNGAELPADYEPQVFSISNPYRNLFFDFGQYYEAIGADLSLLERAVIHERHTPMIWGNVPIVRCSGLSVYLPQFAAEGFDYSSYDYSSLEWAKFLNLK